MNFEELKRSVRYMCCLCASWIFSNEYKIGCDLIEGLSNHTSSFNIFGSINSTFSQNSWMPKQYKDQLVNTKLICILPKILQMFLFSYPRYMFSSNLQNNDSIFHQAFDFCTFFSFLLALDDEHKIQFDKELPMLLESLSSLKRMWRRFNTVPIFI